MDTALSKNRRRKQTRCSLEQRCYHFLERTFREAGSGTLIRKRLDYGLFSQPGLVSGFVAHVRRHDPAFAEAVEAFIMPLWAIGMRSAPRKSTHGRTSSLVDMR